MVLFEAAISVWLIATEPILFAVLTVPSFPSPVTLLVAVKYANVAPTTATNRVATAITVNRIVFFFSITIVLPPYCKNNIKLFVLFQHFFHNFFKKFYFTY